jgi:hypothetical protein
VRQVDHALVGAGDRAEFGVDLGGDEIASAGELDDRHALFDGPVERLVEIENRLAAVEDEPALFAEDELDILGIV